LSVQKLLFVSVFLLFSTIYGVEKTESPQNFNVSVNGVYYSPEFLMMEPTGGASLIFNYKSFRTSFFFGGTNYWEQTIYFFQSNIGGQYDFIKSEKMDAIIFSEFNFNIVTGTFHKWDWPDDESPFYQTTYLAVSTSTGFEYSVGNKNLKFNAGTKIYLPVFLVFVLEDSFGFGIGYLLPGIEIYTGLKF